MESSPKQVDIGELRRQLQLFQKRENLANLRLTVKEKQLRDLMVCLFNSSKRQKFVRGNLDTECTFISLDSVLLLVLLVILSR